MQVTAPTGIDSTIKAYLRFNGANGATVIYDDSQTHNTITQHGNAKISTAASRFGGSSLYSDGVNGSYISIPNGAGIYQGHGNFTLQMWVRRNGDNAYSNRLIEHGVGTGMALHWGTAAGVNTNKISCYLGSTANAITSTTTLSDATWYHVALVRQATNDTRLYINGTSEGGTFATDWNWANPGAAMFVAAYSDGTHSTVGYIDELILQQGVAKWTGNFTPPTRQLI